MFGIEQNLSALSANCIESASENAYGEAVTWILLAGKKPMKATPFIPTTKQR